ncbi:MarR family winged helix-turn-helix transcriptional regulator [Marinicella sp. W31]|uniref:MarR family winged helix-turn-helix transcriptional regulator n=1 Tax=Marinicella sp. W31 TaxID=3023713 RepID=UPI0037570B8C
MELNKFLPYRLSVLSLKISNGIARHYDDFGINVTEWRVMVILNQYRQLNAKQIVSYSQMDKVRVSRTMKTLLDKRLILIDVDAQDARARNYRLSASGKKLVTAVIPAAESFEQRLYDALSKQERQSLDQIIHKLENAIK